MDMLCLMFESDRRGFLQAPSGKPYSHEQLARMTGCSPDEVSHLLAELESSGVYSRTAHGIIFSRRQKRDEENRADHRKRQNDYRNSKKTKENGDASVIEEVTPVSHPSSSSTSSSTSIPIWVPLDAWDGFVEMRKRKGWILTDRAKTGILRDLQKLKDQGQNLTACLDQSTERCYRGVFEVKQNGSASKNSYPPGFFDVPEASRVRN